MQHIIWVSKFQVMSHRVVFIRTFMEATADVVDGERRQEKRPREVALWPIQPHLALGRHPRRAAEHL